MLFALLVCLAAAARALTGVAGGATRAALTAHFCRGSGRKEEEESNENKKNKNSSDNKNNSSSNAGDVAAKEGSQEAACTLVGMLLGLLLTRSSSQNPRLGALAFALLTVLHVYFNAKALRCLRLTGLNRVRLELVVAGMVSSGEAKERPTRRKKAASAAANDDALSSILTPADAAALEPLWPPPLLSFSKRNRVVMGASLEEVAEAAGKSVEDLLLLPPRREDEDGDGGGDVDSSSTLLPFVAAFSAETKRSLVALRSDCSASEEVAAYILGLLLSGMGGDDLKSPEEAERWLRRRWLGQREGRRQESGTGKDGGERERKRKRGRRRQSQSRSSCLSAPAGTR